MWIVVCEVVWGKKVIMSCGIPTEKCQGLRGACIIAGKNYNEKLAIEGWTNRTYIQARGITVFYCSFGA